MVLVRGILVTLERLGTVAAPREMDNILYGPLIRNIANHFGDELAEADLASLYNGQNLLNNFLTPGRPLWDSVRRNNIMVACEGLKAHYDALNERNALYLQLQSATSRAEAGNARDTCKG